MEYPEEKEPPEVITSDTNNATTIQPKEAPPGKRRKFKKMRAYNTGRWNGPKRENKEVIFREDNLHRFDAISSSLGLSDYQKQRGRTAFDDLHVRSIGLKVDTIIFGICVLVANAAVDDGCRYYPNPEAEGDSQFEEVADSLDLDRGDQLSVIEKMRGACSL
jgi:hypothetical protein